MALVPKYLLTQILLWLLVGHFSGTPVYLIYIFLLTFSLLHNEDGKLSYNMTSSTARLLQQMECGEDRLVRSLPGAEFFNTKSVSSGSHFKLKPVQYEYAVLISMRQYTSSNVSLCWQLLIVCIEMQNSGATMQCRLKTYLSTFCGVNDTLLTNQKFQSWKSNLGLVLKLEALYHYTLSNTHMNN